MHPPDSVNQLSNIRRPPTDRLLERDGLVLGHGSKPLHELKITTTDQPTMREQVWYLPGMRRLAVQGSGVRASWIERTDPRHDPTIRRPKRDRPVANPTRRPACCEKRLFCVSVVGSCRDDVLVLRRTTCGLWHVWCEPLSVRGRGF